jgi:hypothetical protein
VRIGSFRRTPLKRRFQVFVCSTYEDLKAERQAAVEAVLKAGHIPAGMELFTAASESQMQVIHRWIDESDIFMLILGGRYGSIEPSSGLSYVESEFTYARKIGKPFFSVVLSDEGREAKVRKHGTAVIETSNQEALQRFRAIVVSHLCAFFSTPQEVKLAVFETLPQLAASNDLMGWVKASDVPDPKIIDEMTRLLGENEKLRTDLEKLRKGTSSKAADIPQFDDLYRVLATEKIRFPAEHNGTGMDQHLPLLNLTLGFAPALAKGVTNSLSASRLESFLFNSVAAPLASLGLVETDGKIPSRVHWQRMRFSKAGTQFVTRVRVGNAKLEDMESRTSSAAVPATSTGKGRARRRKSSTS